MKIRTGFCNLLFLLAGLAPAASIVQAQQAATEETAKPNQIEAMQRLEDAWSTALAKRDQYGMELVLAPQFVNISEHGDVRSRNQEIAHVLNKYPDMISIEQKVVTVRTLGDISVVNGTYVLRRRVNGHPVDEKGVFTHVFQRARSTWQCINAQRTTVIEQAVDKKVAETGKKSGAELPFHIPLFHKGDEPASSPQQQPQQGLSPSGAVDAQPTAPQ